MIKGTVRFLQVDYLLMDSWFTCKKMLACARVCKIHLIGMMKMSAAKYQYKGEDLSAGEILNKLKHKSSRCRKLSAHYIEVDVTFDGHEVKLFFSRFGSQAKWHLILTTDKSLTYLQMMKLYQIRWGIEVFFKESKQYLNLGKSQSEDFSGQIADITVTMLQYILITLKKRFGNYETKGAVFRQGNEEMIALTLDKRLWQLLIELLQLLIELFELAIDDIECLLDKLIQNTKFQKMLESMSWKGV